MSGDPASDRREHGSAGTPAARRARWFARGTPPARVYDQEAEVRATLYAKPQATERTVEHVRRVERMAERPAA